MNNLIGRKIKGFKFESKHLIHVPNMNKHIGEIGEIECVDGDDVNVVFKDDSWHYPLDQIYPHLIPEITTAEAIELLESKGYKVTKEIPIGALCLFNDDKEKFDKNIGQVRLFDGMREKRFLTACGWYWNFCKQITITDV